MNETVSEAVVVETHNSVELSAAPVNALPVQSTASKDLALSAETPEALAHSQKELHAWCLAKLERERAILAEAESDLAECDIEIERIDTFIAAALKGKWSSKPMAEMRRTAEKRGSRVCRRIDVAVARVNFYEKFTRALEAGYYVVPNFPINLFAIRSHKNKPGKQWIGRTTYAQPNYPPTEYQQELAAGTGQYRNPFPLLHTEAVVGPDNKTVYAHKVKDWQEMEFPISMARLNILDAVNRAMALKIFDEIGALPSKDLACGDPVLLGRICVDVPRSGTHLRQVSFMIAWHLDTRTLP